MNKIVHDNSDSQLAICALLVETLSAILRDKFLLSLLMVCLLLFDKLLMFSSICSGIFTRTKTRLIPTKLWSTLCTLFNQFLIYLPLFLWYSIRFIKIYIKSKDFSYSWTLNVVLFILLCSSSSSFLFSNFCYLFDWIFFHNNDHKLNLIIKRRMTNVKNVFWNKNKMSISKRGNAKNSLKWKHKFK